jgi:hypothetical protein
MPAAQQRNIFFIRSPEANCVQMIQLRNEYGGKPEKTATGFSNRFHHLIGLCEEDPELSPAMNSSSWSPGKQPFFC